MAEPRRPPRGESIRLRGLIFRHVFERPSLGAKDEGKPFSCYRFAPFLEIGADGRSLVYRPKFSSDFDVLATVNIEDAVKSEIDTVAPITNHSGHAPASRVVGRNAAKPKPAGRFVLHRRHQTPRIRRNERLFSSLFRYGWTTGAAGKSRIILRAFLWMGRHVYRF
jgi:hypothetical protein